MADDKSVTSTPRPTRLKDTEKPARVEKPPKVIKVAAPKNPALRAQIAGLEDLLAKQVHSRSGGRHRTQRALDTLQAELAAK